MTATPPMETFRIPGSNLNPSRVGLGTWAIGGWMWGGTDDAKSIRTIHAALDRGITLIDTAPVYGFGRSEEIVGKALAGAAARRRVIATKVGLEWKDGGLPQRQPRPHHAGSRRLAAPAQDRPIDLYQVHWPDPNAPIEETAGAMGSCSSREKSAPSASAIFRPRRWTRSAPSRRFTRVQPPYNLFEREIEADVLPYCPRARHCDVGLRRAVPRPPLRAHARRHQIRRRRPARRADPKFQPPRFAEYLAAVARSISSRSNGSASASSISPCAGCSTARPTPSRCGARGTRASSIPSLTSWGGRSTRRRWPRSTVSSRRMCVRRSAGFMAPPARGRRKRLGIGAAPPSIAPGQIPACTPAGNVAGHHIKPRGAPGLTAQQPRQCHPAAGPKAEALDRLVGIFRTGRQMPAFEANEAGQRVAVNLTRGHAPTGEGRCRRI